MNYEVTLAMPVYNVEKYVERALNSALNQTFGSIEFLIVDDKGTDRSMDIVRDIISNHPRGKDVRIIDHGINRGTGATKNTSIKEATGKYLYFMDSDDFLADNCISLLYNAASQNNIDVVVGSFSERDFLNRKGIDRKIKDICYIGTDAFDRFFFSDAFYVQTWNKLYKLSVLREHKVACIASNTNEDIFFTFQLFRAVKSLQLISPITYFYTVNDPNSVTYGMRTKNVNYKHVVQFIGILDRMGSYMMEKEYLEDTTLASYWWHNKIALIQEIVNADNLSYKQKRAYIKQIPVFNISIPTKIKQLSFNGLRWTYLNLDPFWAQKINFVYSVIRRIYIIFNQRK